MAIMYNLVEEEILMLIYVEQDIFKSPAQVIVNAVNTVGVMGKGIAKRFKDVYPDMFKEYRNFCELGSLTVGKLWIYKKESKWVLNFPTKKHCRNPSKIEYIEDGLKKFVETYKEKNITSISFPQLGCGNGGLNWEHQVKPLMEKYLKNLPIDIFIHVRPNSNLQMEHMNIAKTLQWLRKNPRDLSITQLIDDMKESIEANKHVLGKSGKWSIAISNGDDGLEFDVKSKDHSLVITYGSLYDMWIKLRDYGYLISYDLPVEVQNYSNIVFEFLEQLPYIEQVSVFNLTGSKIAGVTINKYNLPEFKYNISESIVNE